VSAHAKITPSGTLTLPEDLRRRYGLADGGDVVIEDSGDGLVIRTLPQAIARAQATGRKFLAENPDASVDDFLADRRAEAARE
jgi:bifunctional DNA-binding transcriptional regulator/antitoxin component of YhaV-PrlF toxin-antitoxin module